MVWSCIITGWAFAYGDKTTCDDAGVCSSVGNPFIGTEQFAMSNLADTSFHTFYFQYVVSPCPLNLHSSCKWVIAEGVHDNVMLIDDAERTLGLYLRLRFCLTVRHLHGHNCLGSRGRAHPIHRIRLVCLLHLRLGLPW